VGVLRAGVRAYTDEELTGHLYGHYLACVSNLVHARKVGQPIPPLYAAGVRYIREPPGSEVWQLPREALSARGGDCEDLACWLAAERAVAGDREWVPHVIFVSPTLRHIVARNVRTNEIEDPSRRLGMKGPG
jgi:hypothetical protein